MCKNRKPLKVFIPQMILVALIIWGGWAYVGYRFTVGIDAQNAACLPFRYFLIDKTDKEIPTLGYVAFRVDHRVEPHFMAGDRFIKQIRGQAGDHVQVKNGRVFINSQFVAELDPHALDVLKRSASDFDRDLILQPQDIWVMGTSKDAFDSRYWGPVHAGQIVGQVYPII